MFKFFLVVLIAAMFPFVVSAQSTSQTEPRRNAEKAEAAYRGKALCVSDTQSGGQRIRVVKKSRVQSCSSVIDLDGMSINVNRRKVIFSGIGKTHTFSKPDAKACEDPDGDFKHCNKTCNDVPQTPSEGVHGCKLGCLAAFIWDAVWCDAPPVPPEQVISN